MSDHREQIIKYAEENAKTYQEIALAIHDKPEVSNYEFFACETLSNQLRSIGFSIETAAAGHRTGFAATYKSGKEGPTVAFLAEYDALAGLGHGCGHNIFGATSSLAAAAFKAVIDEIGGEVRVYGTPGEEGGEEGSSKASFADKGYLDDVDFALCTHPGTRTHNSLSTRNYACAPVDIEFHGRSAHAAGCPQDGLNALDAQILVYNAISVLRQQLTDRIRIHGIIVDGGLAPNVIPDYTKSKYYLRAVDRETLDDLYAKVENIVKGSALSTGTEGSIHLYQNLVENMVLTPRLDAVYEKNLNSLGLEVKHLPNPYKVMPGSSDVGNISKKVPTIQTVLSITDTEIPEHSIEMVKASASPKALDSIVVGAKALALTAYDLFTDPNLLREVKEDHKYNLEHSKEFPIQ